MLLDTELATNEAMSIGLTQVEAEQAVAHFQAIPDYSNYCENCGVLLEESKNCQNDILDNYCNTCWSKAEKELTKGI